MIELLPDAIANQIAAGEVIQRPASIVKELLENALDAEATHIRLFVKDAGKTLVQVIDNGKGMDEHDARLCFERHATSKIKTSDDLFHIRTMGFRGEALASIAAVAQVNLKTRPANQKAGTEILMEGSELQQMDVVAMNPGTHIAVRNLFFNVPARRKFLKSDPVELRHIQDEFQRVALAHPEIKLEFYHNDKEMHILPPHDLRKRVIALMGKNWEEHLVPVKEETDLVKITGFVGKPEKSRKTRGDQHFFVNKRFFKSSYLHHAIKMAFEDLIPKDHYPFYLLFFEIDPSYIDVNVHPTKQEIKFEDQRLIYNYLKVAVRHALGKYQVMPTINFDQSSGQVTASSGSFSGGGGSDFRQQRPQGNPDDWASFFNVGSSHENDEDGMTLSSRVNQEESEKSLFQDEQSSKPYQIHKSYILSPVKSGFLIIDQSLAHERILYEDYLSILNDQQMQIQQQLYPSTVELPASEAHLIEEMLPVLKKLGFDIQPFGKNTFVIHGLPSAGLDMPAAEDLIEELVDHFKNDRVAQLSLEENVARALARSSAIQKGKKLEAEEIEHLLGKLFNCTEPNFSPGGRPCFITYTLDDLRKKFSKA
jgi:DNA mismatch repair protein MutL